MRFPHWLLVTFATLILTPLFAQTEKAQVELMMVDMEWPDVKTNLEMLSGSPIDDQTTEPVGKFNLHCAQPITVEEAYSILTQLLFLHGVKLETHDGDDAKLVATNCPPMTAKELRYLPLRKRAPQLLNKLSQDETSDVNMRLINLDAHNLTLNLHALTRLTIIYNWLPTSKINYISEGGITRLAAIEVIDNWLMQNGIVLAEKGNCLLALPIAEPDFSKPVRQGEVRYRIIPKRVSAGDKP